MAITRYFVTSLKITSSRAGSYAAGIQIRSAHTAHAMVANPHAAAAVRRTLGAGMLVASSLSCE